MTPRKGSTKAVRARADKLLLDYWVSLLSVGLVETDPPGRQLATTTECVKWHHEWKCKLWEAGTTVWLDMILKAQLAEVMAVSWRVGAIDDQRYKRLLCQLHNQLTGVRAYELLRAMAHDQLPIEPHLLRRPLFNHKQMRGIVL